MIVYPPYSCTLIPRKGAFYAIAIWKKFLPYLCIIYPINEPMPGTRLTTINLSFPKKMKKTLFPLLGIAILGAGFIAAVPQHRYQATRPYPGGSRDNCGTKGTNCACNHQRVPVEISGITYSVDFTGSMTLECIDTGTTPPGYLWRTQRPTAFDVTGTDPTLGSIHVYLDNNRISSNAYMESLNTTNEYPVQHDVYAYAEMTMSSQPGRTYRSVQQFHMQSPSIASFGTGNLETYSVMSNVDFFETGAPGGLMITVKPAPITANP